MASMLTRRTIVALIPFGPQKAWLPGLAEPEDVLPDAVKKLREWASIPRDEAATSDAEAVVAAT